MKVALRRALKRGPKRYRRGEKKTQKVIMHPEVHGVEIDRDMGDEHRLKNWGGGEEGTVLISGGGPN